MELKYIEDIYDKSVQIPIRFVKENVANNLLTLPPFTSCNRPKHTDKGDKLFYKVKFYQN